MPEHERRFFKIVVPRAFLKAHRQDSIMLLRMGAAANAIEATLRHLVLADEGDDRPATRLGRLQAPLAAAAYLGELVKMIEKEGYADRLWKLVERAVDDGFELAPPVAEARELLSSRQTDIGGPLLLKLRDKVTFHWDRQPFASFIDDVIEPDVDIWETDGKNNIDRIFTGSADATARFFIGVPAAGFSLTDILPILTRAHGVIGSVVEAGWVELLVEAGEDPRRFFVQE